MAFNFLSIQSIHYSDALILQENLFNELIQSKAENKVCQSTLIFLQHNPVYTLGKSGNIKHLKVPIEETGADFYQTNRGGDITYHGPGQLTAYPIFDLDAFGMGVRHYVTSIEECIIDCLAIYGLKGARINGASGVWLGAGTENERKICAIGIKVSRGVSMHGFAFNINTALSYFNHIVPCGLENKGVTSLQNEMGHEIDFIQLETQLLKLFEQHFPLKK